MKRRGRNSVVSSDQVRQVSRAGDTCPLGGAVEPSAGWRKQWASRRLGTTDTAEFC